MSFANLKRNSRKSNISKLVEEAKKQSPGRKNYNDDRIWKPTVDKLGNGYAVIRFLPSTENSDLPWVQYWDHGFQGPTGQWYIEKSLTSIGQPDPVSEYNSKIWNSGLESDKDIVRRQKRRLHYVSNIYVVSDSGNPDNEGKTFLFQYGKKIFDKIQDAMSPEFEDEDPVDPFNMWDGANFKLKIRQVEGYRNYDKSEFESPSQLKDDDGELEKIYNQLYDLSEFTDPSNYKTYDELQTRLNTVLQLNQTSTQSEKMEDVPTEEPKTIKEVESKMPVESDEFNSSEEDDSFSFFEKLAAEED